VVLTGLDRVVTESGSKGFLPFLFNVFYKKKESREFVVFVAAEIVEIPTSADEILSNFLR